MTTLAATTQQVQEIGCPVTRATLGITSHLLVRTCHTGDSHPLSRVSAAAPVHTLPSIQTG